MDSYRSNFNQRVAKLNDKHARLAQGYVARVRSDGLIAVEPKKAERMRIPLRPIALVLLGVICFKAFLMASLGAVTYEDRISALTEGSAAERVGAYVMQRDPLSALLADKFTAMMP